jgi:rod shape determining protein RodA
MLHRAYDSSPGRPNWLLAAVTVVLLAVGLLFIYSACVPEDGSRSARAAMFTRQQGWVAVGLLCFLAAAWMDYRKVAAWGWGFYAVGLVLLVVVLVFGVKIYGARRWLDLHVAGIRIQPAEIAKLATILVLGQYLSRPELDRTRWRTLFVVLGIVAAPMLLIMKEPDLGTSLVLVPIALAMIFVAGFPGRRLIALLGAGLALVVVVLGLMFLPEHIGVSPARQQALLRSVGLSAYHKERILVFLQPDRDPMGTGWNRRQSEIAVGSGGVFGKGFRQGTQNILGFLPRSVAPTDFIFSVIAEETGFLGSCMVLGLFAALIGSGLYTAVWAGDRLGRLLGCGISAMLFAHVLVNIGMTVGVFPITGLPLPLVSYGGTFMVVVMTGLGIIQSVHRRS